MLRFVRTGELSPMSQHTLAEVFTSFTPVQTRSIPINFSKDHKLLCASRCRAAGYTDRKSSAVIMPDSFQRREWPAHAQQLLSTQQDSRLCCLPLPQSCRTLSNDLSERISQPHTAGSQARSCKDGRPHTWSPCTLLEYGSSGRRGHTWPPRRVSSGSHL